MSLIIPILLIIAIVAIELAAFLRVHQKRAETVKQNIEFERLIRSGHSIEPHESHFAHNCQFHIHPLPPEDRKRLSDQWQVMQCRFIDEPSKAVERADRLLKQVLQAQGYPVHKIDEAIEPLAIYHPRVAEEYRAAQEVAEKNRTGNANVEELRQAMIYYRDLFEDLIETEELELVGKGA